MITVFISFIKDLFNREPEGTETELDSELVMMKHPATHGTHIGVKQDGFVGYKPACGLMRSLTEQDNGQQFVRIKRLKIPVEITSFDRASEITCKKCKKFLDGKNKHDKKDAKTKSRLSKIRPSARSRINSKQNYLSVSYQRLFDSYLQVYDMRFSSETTRILRDHNIDYVDLIIDKQDKIMTIERGNNHKVSFNVTSNAKITSKNAYEELHAINGKTDVCRHPIKLWDKDTMLVDIDADLLDW